ncbi:MAG: response regulator transcription factor [Pseudomonadota bacterium]
MKRHVFITARAQPISRWTEAFPNARIIHNGESDALDATALAGASIVWLHVGGDARNLPFRVQSIRNAAPQAHIVVLSNIPEDGQGLAALGAGAVGYCSALALPSVLKQVANAVEHGGLWIGPQLMCRLMQGLAARAPNPAPSLLDQLSQRERQVALAVAQGASNKEIARAMNITERTVKAHLSSIFGKLGVRDRMQLSLLVNGIEEPPRQTNKKAR